MGAPILQAAVSSSSQCFLLRCRKMGSDEETNCSVKADTKEAEILNLYTCSAFDMKPYSLSIFKVEELALITDRLVLD